MIRGIYTAASGMIAESERNDVIANNLANASTVGYKKDITVTKDFQSILIQRINDGSDRPAIGKMGTGAVVDEIATDQTAGSMRSTGNPLDLGLEGNGFFTVQTPNGIRYTRDGEFSLNAQGQLVTREGYAVLGNGGPITLADAKTITVTGDGRVLMNPVGSASGSEDAEVDTLRIANFTDLKQLSKEGANLFRAGADAQEAGASATVQQGMLEQANVNPVMEMVNMISSYRAYEISAKLVQAHDELLNKAVNNVASV
jgi:flagellar basal-body rod protein FlgF